MDNIYDLTLKTWRIQTREIPLLDGRSLWEACLEAYNPDSPLPHWYQLGDSITGITRENAVTNLKSNYCHNLTGLWQTEETHYAPTFTCHERTPQEDEWFTQLVEKKIQQHLRNNYSKPSSSKTSRH